VTAAVSAEDLWRQLAPQVLGTLVRRYGQFETAEDATQEALLQASVEWPRDGIPRNPRGWLTIVASRRMIEMLRAEQARRRRQDVTAQRTLREWSSEGFSKTPEVDDTLILLFLCCHPTLTAEAQICLTLRAVGGLTTAEIARAFLVSESAMTRRITRAKATIRDSGVPFRMPRGQALQDRLTTVLQVLYLIYNEGYATTAGESLRRSDLTTEAIRLTRIVHRQLPDDPEATGLLALMLLTEARGPARVDAHGDLVPMADQDRSLWDARLILEGIELITAAVAHHAPGFYQLQAAIAALHDEAPTADRTDWAEIRSLYERLAPLSGGNPIVSLNHVVAVAMTDGPTAGHRLLDDLDADPRVRDHPRFHAVRAHLHEMDGDRDAANTAYLIAAARTTSIPQKRYLHRRAARMTDRSGGRRPPEHHAN
jgi:RNA polymerase sigma factor (sigma-70 family)